MIGDDGLHQAIDLLPQWLRRQHWFAGNRSGPIDVALVSATLLADAAPRLWHLLVEVGHSDGTDVYQIPLSMRREWADRLAHVRLGQTDDGHVYDALHDKDATAILLGHFDDAGSVGNLSFHLCEDVKLPLHEPSLVMPGEHRNTSLAYGDVALLKVFRKVEPGINPDVEVNEALAAAGCDLVAPLFGWMDGTWRDASGTHSASIALLRGYLTTASDGWALASTSVRDLYAYGDLHPNEAGGDFAAEAYRLGMATARVHETMAEALPTATLFADDIVALADSMDQRLTTAVMVVPELESFVPGLRARFDLLRNRDVPVQVQRIHGSYHLGQVLRTVVGWKLVDFEGEAVLRLTQRRALYSPLRDVAQMLRSLDYAAQHLLITDHPPENPTREQIVHRAREWTERNTRAFCTGYAAASTLDPRENLDVLYAHETDRAVYEVTYEARRRPSWLPIPLSAIERLATTANLAGPG